MIEKIFALFGLVKLSTPGLVILSLDDVDLLDQCIEDNYAAELDELCWNLNFYPILWMK